MKTAKFTLMFLACSAALPALAQNSSPQCGSTNFDQGRNVFTIMNATADAVNQQCFLTVIPSGTTPEQSRQHPAPYLVEGSYVVELSGGGGGGGGGASRGQRDGASKESGGGGGGAGAAPSRTVQYFSPGIYRLTIGTGGDGGRPNGGLTEDGNPTSVTNAHTGQLMAGFPGADVWRQGTQPAGSGRGGAAQAGASSGQDGQISAGGASSAGGSGGAGVGSGGAGDSARRITVAGIGDLGGGGGGGRGGVNTADAGGRGGHGFIRVALQTAAAPAAPAAQQAPTGAVAQGSERQSTPATVARPMRKDRN